jgi:hypothetical protein
MLGFKCVGGGDYLRISHVELDDTSEGDQFMPYTGPVFDELDETLQQAFVDYLEERGGWGWLGKQVGGIRALPGSVGLFQGCAGFCWALKGRGTISLWQHFIRLNVGCGGLVRLPT